jgi:hypothetical protein
MSDIKKKKAELQKQLNDLHEIEQKENKNKFAVLVKTLKSDIENYQSLCSFKKHGKIKVELSYNIECFFDSHDLGDPNPDWKGTDPDSADLGEFEGNCYVIVKEPKNHNVAMFIAEDSFGNMSVDDYKGITSIHPDVKKHCDKFLKAKRNLSQKIVKTAEKLDLDIDDAFDAVYRTLK